MTKKCRNIIVISIVFIIFLIATGLYLYLSRPVLSHTKLTIYTGYSKTICLYGRYDVKEWTSDNENIAMVEDGMISAINTGNTCITADTGKKKFVCEVEVREAVSPKYYSIVNEEKKWLFEQQLDNGAFCNRIKENGEVNINPYFSAISVWCVLQCDLTDDEKDKIKEHLQWHFDHINYEKDYNGISGTVYDYKAKLEDGTVIEEYTNESYDSSDSYAAMFLAALWKYYEVTGDSEFIINNSYKIKLVTGAMLSTLSYGYTYCKPDYTIIYLMDNAEVYEGMVSSEKIFREVLKDEEDADYVQKIKDNFIGKFEKTWWRDDHYSPYLNNELVPYEDKFSWSNFYSDAVSQLSPIIFDLSDSDKSEIVYKEFCNYRKWENMDYFYSGEAKFYWGMLMYGAVKMADYDRAEKYLEVYLSETENKEYPLIISDCAWVILGTKQIGDYYKTIEINSIK